MAIQKHPNREQPPGAATRPAFFLRRIMLGQPTPQPTGHAEIDLTAFGKQQINIMAREAGHGYSTCDRWGTEITITWHLEYEQG